MDLDILSSWFGGWCAVKQCEVHLFAVALVAAHWTAPVAERNLSGVKSLSRLAAARGDSTLHQWLTRVDCTPTRNARPAISC